MIRTPAIVLAALGLACALPEPPPPPVLPPEESPRRGGRPAPDGVDPRLLAQVTCLTRDGEALLVGSEEGLLEIDLASLRHRCWGRRDGVGAVSDVAVSSEGVRVVAQRLDEHASDQAPGGLRAWETTPAWGSGVAPPLRIGRDAGLTELDVSVVTVHGDDLVAVAGGRVHRVVLDAVLARALDRPEAAEPEPSEPETVATERADDADATASTEGADGAESAEDDSRFRLESAESRRTLTVVDADGRRRTRTEFRSPRQREQALSTTESGLWIGSSHGLFRRGADGLERHVVPCGLEGRPLRSVLDIATHGNRLLAVVSAEEPEAPWVLGTLWHRGGELTCFTPDLDVPGGTSHDVSLGPKLGFLGTDEGLLVVSEDGETELFDALRGAPDAPVTAVLADGDGGCFFGTWGAGVHHWSPEAFVRYGLGADGRVVVEASPVVD
ncbi:MAG: hypothetical protein AAF533_00655 [Acidobacteriota bacterium]